MSCGYGLDFNIPPKAADNTEGKINPCNLLKIFQLLLFCSGAGRECCVILYTERKNIPHSETVHCPHSHSQQGGLQVAKSMRY